MDMVALPIRHIRLTASYSIHKDLQEALSTWGCYVRYERRRRGLTQAEVGQFIGVTENTVTTWELSQNKPQTSSIPRIIKFLKYNPFPFQEAAEFNEMFRRHRAESGLCHRTYAELVGIDPTTVLHIENGRRASKKTKRKFKKIIKSVIV